jgi:hypothetical protein
MDHVSRDWSFTWVPNTVLEDDTLSEHAVMVYMAIARFASNDERSAFPSLASIGKIARVSKPTVIKAKAELIAAGYLTQTQRADEKGQQSNLYVLRGTPVSEVATPGKAGIPPLSTSETTPVKEVDTNYTHVTIPKELDTASAKNDPLGGALFEGDGLNEPTEYAPMVTMTPLQYARLVCEFGEKRIVDFIDRVSLWQRAKKGKPAYKDYNAAIRDWLRRDGQTPSRERRKCPNCGNDTFDGVECHACGHTVDFAKMRSEAVANL